MLQASHRNRDAIVRYGASYDMFEMKSNGIDSEIAKVRKYDWALANPCQLGECRLPCLSFYEMVEEPIAQHRIKCAVGEWRLRDIAATQVKCRLPSEHLEGKTVSHLLQHMG